MRCPATSRAGARFAGWLLTLFPAVLCIGLLVDLAHGAQKLGQAGYNSDLRTLSVSSGLPRRRRSCRPAPKMGMALLDRLAPQRVVLRVVVYLTFFWKVFS